MNEAFEGDLIRPLGLVTLYCGYAERELDELLQALSAGQPSARRKRQWTIGQKLTCARELVLQLKREDLLSGLSNTLAEGTRIFERRNALIHGCVYSGGRVVSNREGVPEVVVSAQDLTTFAETVFNWKEQIWLHRQQYLPRALDEAATRPPRTVSPGT